MKPGRRDGDESAVYGIARRSVDGAHWGSSSEGVLTDERVLQRSPFGHADIPWGEEITQKVHEVLHLLQTVFGLTRSLCENATADEIDKVTDLLHERERLLKMALDLRDAIVPHIQDQKNRHELSARVVSLLSAITASNEALVGILQAKKKIVLDKLKEAQMQKSVLSYSH